MKAAYDLFLINYFYTFNSMFLFHVGLDEVEIISTSGIAVQPDVNQMNSEEKSPTLDRFRKEMIDENLPRQRLSCHDKMAWKN